MYDFLKNKSEKELIDISDKIKDILNEIRHESVMKKFQKYIGEYYRCKTNNEYILITGISEHEMFETLFLFYNYKDNHVEISYQTLYPLDIVDGNSYEKMNRDEFRYIFDISKRLIEKLYNELI